MIICNSLLYILFHNTALFYNKEHKKEVRTNINEAITLTNVAVENIAIGS